MEEEGERSDRQSYDENQAPGRRGDPNRAGAALPASEGQRVE
jgi:hypothetical protein